MEALLLSGAGMEGGHTALHLAARAGYCDLVRRLVEEGGSDIEGETVLNSAMHGLPHRP